MADRRIGINLYSLRDYTQEPEALTMTLKRVKDMGYQGVQISGIQDPDPAAIADAVRSVGIPVAATHLGWELLTRDIDAVLNTHRLYECPHVAIGGLPDGYHSLEGLRQFVRELDPVLTRLQADGLDFSYHNHNHELAPYDGQPWLGRLISDTSSVGLNLEIDTYWIQAGGGDPVEWIKRCAGRVPLLHLKDMTITPAREQRFAPVGDGNLEWDKILRAADECGVEWYLVEQDTFYGADEFEQVERSCRFLRRELGI